MTPHKDCIDRLQSLIGCACIGDCLTEGRGTLLEKKDKKDERIAELENIVNWHEDLRIKHEKSYAQLVELYDGLIQNHKNLVESLKGKG